MGKHTYQLQGRLGPARSPLYDEYRRKNELDDTDKRKHADGNTTEILQRRINTDSLKKKHK